MDALFTQSEEDSMDEEKVKQVAIDYAAIDYLDKIYPHFGRDRLKCIATKGRAYEGISRKLSQEYISNCWAGDYDEDTRLAIIKISPLMDDPDVEEASWYPDPKPKAKLILDECGVKTYEVDGITDKHAQKASMADKSKPSKLVVEADVQINSDSGKRYRIAHKDGLPGDELVELWGGYDTAKQALESLGYEVEE